MGRYLSQGALGYAKTAAPLDPYKFKFVFFEIFRGFSVRLLSQSALDTPLSPVYDYQCIRNVRTTRTGNRPGDGSGASR